jgi:hypothetical protein
MKTGGAEVYLYSFDLDVSWGWVVNAKPQPLVGPQVRLWTGTENLAPTKIRFLDGSVRSESLYGLHYHGV